MSETTERFKLMILLNKSGCWQFGLVSVLLISEATISASLNCLLAQIVPDGTLGDESSALAPNAEVKGLPAQLIEGGAARGSNLFHSFTEFNVGELQRVYFANPTGIENILSRVTGSNVSNILGTLGIDGSANLFFLNPNGIIFGENAQLDVAGSFVGSTANSFVFPDGSEFSATNPTAPPLLTINLTPGLQYGQNPRGDIVNSGNLTVAPRHTLSMSGKDVTSTGNLTAPGGTVQLLGERVGLLDNAKIDVSNDTGGGNVFVGGNFQGRGSLPNAKRTYIGQNVNINADALTTGDGGRVIIWGNEITGFYGNISARGGSVVGNGGLVEVSGKEQLIFRGHVDTSALSGFSGILLLDPTNITIADGTGDDGGDGTDSFAGNNSGVAGSILSTPLSEINDTAPITIYESELEGLSGDTNVFLQATNNITVNDLSNNELNFAAGRGAIAFTADADGNGLGNFVMEDTADTINTNGRNIGISGASLTLGNIDTVADGAGSIKLNATNGNISTRNLNASSNVSSGGEITLNAEGDITLDPGASISSNGLRGGNIAFKSNGNIIINGTVNASANSVSGFVFLDNGGEITLVADGDITLQSGSVIGSIGLLGGNINLKSNNGNFFINDSLITSITRGSGDKGGDIQLDAQSIYLNDFARVANLTLGQADGGDLTVNASRDNGVVKLSMSKESNSSTVGTGNPIFDLIQDEAFSGTVLATGTGGAGNAGNLSINTNEFIIRNDSDLTNNQKLTAGVGTLTFPAIDILGVSLPASSGDAGNLTVIAYDSVKIIGNEPGSFAPTLTKKTASEIITLRTGLTTVTLGSGQPGNLEIQTRELTMQDGVSVNAGTLGTGNNEGERGILRVTGTDSGELELVTLQGKAILITGTGGLGNATDLFVRANKVELLDGAAIAADTISSGDAGDLTISTNQLTIKNGSRVSAATADEGTGGNIIVMGLGDNATVNPTNLVTVEGTSANGSTPSGIFTNSEDAGVAGNITINTRNLTIQDRAEVSASTSGGAGGTIKVIANTFDARNGGKLLTTTSGESSAGSIILNVSDNITLAGDNTGIFANTTSKSTGNGGSIFIDPETIILQDGASIAVNSQGSGEGGNIQLQAGSLTLANQSAITAETFSTDGGNIEIALGGNLILRDNSEISASAGTDEAGGDGGNIDIDAQFILSFPDENKITAEAFLGTGGNINITTNSIFGREFLEISVSSELGLEGTVSINTLELELSPGLVELPSKLETLSIPQGCEASRGRGSSFISSGRGGLPSSPTETLSSGEVWKDVQLPTQLSKNSANTTKQSNTTTERIVEATSWIINEEGIVELVAEESSDTHQGSCR